MAVSADNLTDLVRLKWTEWFEGPVPDAISWVLAGTGRPIADAAVMLFAFGPGSHRPFLVAKVNRDRVRSDVIQGEFVHQRKAFDLTLSEWAGTVPRPLGSFDIGGDLYAFSQYVESDTSWNDGSPDWKRAMELELVDWLAALHEASKRPTAEPDLHAVRSIAETFTDIFDPGASVRNVLGEAAEIMCQEHSGGSDSILVHGDFWPGNWIFHDNQFAVVDWEHARHSSSPALDEFLYPLSVLTDLDNLRDSSRVTHFSDLYRDSRGIPRRSRSDAFAAALWVSAEVATRTYRRWGVIEDWSHRWGRVTSALAPWV